MPQKMSPLQVNSTEKAARLQTDHHDLRDFWILTDGYTVTICKQRRGEAHTESVSIPRDKFLRLLDWFQKPQQLREPGK